MRVHFIAIGGAAMHKLAICLHQKGDKVTGSDDFIREPSKSHLAICGLLPEKLGWYPERITNDIDVVVLGMHARPENPELIEAKRKGLKICSLPEYLFLKMRDKMRVVISGSDKSMITAMVMHVLKGLNTKFDYLIGTPPSGFDTSLSLSDETRIAIIEGDEYLTSVIDKRPKFHIFQPHIAVISDLEWDYFDAYPSMESYIEQFQTFTTLIERDGKFIYPTSNETLQEMAETVREDITAIDYKMPEYEIKDGNTTIHTKYGDFKLLLFGAENMLCVDAARNVCRQIGIQDKDFYAQIQTFKGIRGKLELLAQNDSTAIYYDNAHTPVGIAETIKSLKELYPQRKIMACVELYSYSMLSTEYIKHNIGCMDESFNKIVFYNPNITAYEGRTPITDMDIKEAFGPTTVIYTDNIKLMDNLANSYLQEAVLVFISPSNFSNMNLKAFAESVLSTK